jgi:precorrin-2 dehydrogenase / sirohydrochlorin ferrochelatase
MRQTYTMMIDLTERHCLVVGGGAVAERKVKSLLESGADVTVVSPTVTPQLQDWALNGRIKWISRLYRSEDGENCFIVIAATNDPKVNEQIGYDALKRQQWVNVVDKPELGNFTVPATLHRGRLSIAISTSGVSPSLARKIRQDLQAFYGDEYALLLELLAEMRLLIQEKVADPQKRVHMMREFVSDRWVRACRDTPDQVRRQMLEWIEQQL